MKGCLVDPWKIHRVYPVMSRLGQPRGLAWSTPRAYLVNPEYKVANEDGNALIRT